MSNFFSPQMCICKSVTWLCANVMMSHMLHDMSYPATLIISRGEKEQSKDEQRHRSVVWVCVDNWKDFSIPVGVI